MIRDVFKRKFIVPLVKKEGAAMSKNPNECMIFVLEDEDLFQKFISSHAVEKMNEKLNSYLIDEFEDEFVELKDLPSMIELISEEINDPRNCDVVVYLEKCLEMMKIALEKETYFWFSF